MLKKLWIDDIRNPPNDGYDIARTYDTAILLLTENEYDLACFDHDLACFDETGRERTGYDVLLFLAERGYNGGHVPATYAILTANPSGRPRMVGVIQQYLGGHIIPLAELP